MNILNELDFNLLFSMIKIFEIKLLMNKWLKVFSTEENKILVLNLKNNVLDQPRSTLNLF